MAECQDLEEFQAIFYDGRYALSQPYKKLLVESSMWYFWSEARRKDQVKRFCQYVISLNEDFPKPSNAGRKPEQIQRI